ncbi:hypothetical protein TraAM80_00942 [Trypanosoma rangeli]|uniref:Uncharacterized protein n=1 Tax=Trypanosoma rangeli TaxID=5698 RepID=A0A422P0Q6_TRYRA|nr:uncharacterized protein TraAM80_00942 [Trypanosoma rangeli]RNF11306.1 hypothetical protein TraAM80_00942 [Trypanosoma rangeli]|eukprot:RNF11306.1 hypothetical protein TraAM80_00942 [Trypanosoma rangeli]
MSTAWPRTTSRSRLQRSALSARKASAALPPLARWKIDDSGRIVNFDAKVLRKDILQRLKDGRLYTLQECRAFLLELTRVAAAWQEEEIPQLMYLVDMHEKLVPGAPISFQWSTSNAELLPLANMAGVKGTLPMLTKVVEEMNRAVARMIDRLWESRRERLLFAARLLQDIEPLLRGVDDGALLA